MAPRKGTDNPMATKKKQTTRWPQNQTTDNAMTTRKRTDNTMSQTNKNNIALSVLFLEAIVFSVVFVCL
jgi:hypothetical protein